ncbi:MAG: hypothetical protein CL868_12945 [Cytophagaceae bacterium]|nr:hypothetical protein [Cytophagaceae bacterium]
MGRQIWILQCVLAASLVFFSCKKGKVQENEAHEKEETLPQVAVMGMLHFVSKNNTVSQEFTHVQGKRRQKEIKELVTLLAGYKPTKIAVERPYRSEAELNKQYGKYLDGDYTLTDEETDQIAFRLGKMLGHKKLYLAYAPVEYAFDAAVDYARKNGQYAIMDSIVSNAKKLAQRYDDIARDSSIKDAIVYLNTQEAIDQNHYGYQLLSQIGDRENTIGAQAMGDWYTSNVRIFENIRKMINRPSDRVLVIYGQGHCKLLNQLIDDSPQLRLVSINDYLE